MTAARHHEPPVIAGYAADVPDATQDPKVAAAAAAAADVADIAHRFNVAQAARTAAIRDAWPTIQAVGPRAFADMIGVSEGTVRSAVADLARDARLKGQRVGGARRRRTPTPTQESP